MNCNSEFRKFAQQLNQEVEKKAADGRRVSGGFVFRPWENFQLEISELTDRDIRVYGTFR